MVEKKTKAVEKTAPKKDLSYAQMLEARAQRGSMTHQKQFAITVAKKKGMKEK